MAQIEATHGKEVLRIWKKAVVHTIYRGLPEEETCREIEYNSGRKSVMVRGVSLNTAQVNGSGENRGEQARPLLQVEDTRIATGGEKALLHARDLGFFQVELPNFFERPEMSGMLRDVGTRLHKHAHLKETRLLLPAPREDDDEELEDVMAAIRARTA